ncbi:MAG: sel1 repeat family protein [Rhodospirillales bacterium]|nr:sel1 repeat family protein [Rhodospirillales bacterium]
MSSFKHLFLAFALLLAQAPSAWADLAEAQAAYAKGDYEEAARLATDSANAGVRDSHRLLGEMRENGRGLAQNDALAWAHYSKAAMSGDAESQFRLGRIYEAGRGVPQSFAEAVKWYQRASLSGHVGAKARLGRLTMAGKGGKVSFSKGLALIQEAALMGEPEAETALADLERRGLASTRQMVERGPVDAESAAILTQAKLMATALGAPPPLGPGMNLGGEVFLALRGASAWTVILPKPETAGSDASVWRAASIRLVIAKSGDDQLDVRIQLPSAWRNLNHAGRELGKLEIGSQSLTGLWSMAQGRWLRHNAQYSALRLASVGGAGSVDSIVSTLTSPAGSDGAPADQTQILRLAKGAFKGQHGDGFAFDEVEATSTLKGFDAKALLNTLRADKDPAPILNGLSSRITAKGLNLFGPSRMAQDLRIAGLSMDFEAQGLEQDSSALSLGFEAFGIGSTKPSNPASTMPADIWPESVRLHFAADRLPLRDVSNQIAALLMSKSQKSAAAGRVASDLFYDAAATVADILIDARSEFRIEEASVKAPFWSVNAKGAFVPERGKSLPVSGTLSIVSQGLDPLIKALDDGSNVAALFLDGLRRTTPPKKDALGNDLFDVVLRPDGSIDINGQRWSGPDQPQKQPSGKPVPLTKKKK